jgi:hypothetical protein
MGETIHLIKRLTVTLICVQCKFVCFYNKRATKGLKLAIKHI